MAIASVNDIAAGFKPPERFMKSTSTMEAAGVLSSLFYLAGLPGAATAPSPGVNGASLTSYAGQIPFPDPGSNNAYLAGVTCNTSVAGTLLVCDRLWHNSGLSVTDTSPQALTSTAWPARDKDGSTNGEGVYIGMEVSGATTGVSANTVVISYVNSTATGGTRTATFTTPASALAVNSFFIASLQGDDTGVRSVSAFDNSISMSSGTIHLVAFRILAEVPVSSIYSGANLDWADLGLPRMYSNSVPFLLWLPSATTAATIQGNLRYTHG